MHTEEIFDAIKEIQTDLKNDGVTMAKKPVVFRNDDGNIVVSVDYLNPSDNDSEWELSIEIEV